MSKHNPRVLALMMVSGAPERLHMALMMAAAAASTGRKVLVFAAKSALPAFRKGGWDALGGAAYDAHLMDRGVADFSVMIDALKSMNVRFVLCDQAMQEHALEAADMADVVRTSVSGLAALMAAHPDAEWVTF